ncbi:MAG: hypothetical protein HY875_16635 [Chloroflexi bacterium]|nr:hypothetical protein [Chloroflexota bacterium]
MEQPRTPGRAFAGMEPLAAGLVCAAGVELLVLRTFTRTAVHIPGIEALAGPYNVVADFGRFAYYLSVVLLIAALPALAWRLWRSGDLAARVAGVVVVAFIAAAGGARWGIVSGYWIDAASIGAVLLLAAVGPSFAPWRQAAVAGAFAAAFALSGTHSLAQTATDPSLRFDSGGLLTPAEVAALLFALGTPLLVMRQPVRKEWLIAGAAAVLAYAVFAGNPWTTRILLLWNAGLSGSFPSVVYGAAAGAFTLTVVALFRDGRRLEAFGLLLLLGGGIGLHSTYQTGLVVAGAGLFLAGASAMRPGRAPARSAVIVTEPRGRAQARVAVATPRPSSSPR